MVEASGQEHHLISNKIDRALKQHKMLKGVFDRENPNLKFNAKDLDAHKGYQKWHRAVDKEVVEWLTDTPNATKEQFLEKLNEIYQRPEIADRIPNVDLLNKKKMG